MVNSNFSTFARKAEIKTVVNDLQYNPNFSFVSLGTDDNKSDNTIANVNFKHSFDSTGRVRHKGFMTCGQREQAERDQL